MTRIQNLKNYISKHQLTLLGVGPMSKNVVDAAIAVANEKDFPMIMIASRRQIEAAQFGGGYVNSWDTKSFADYVRSQDKAGNIYLARDHGGPWQGEFEVNEGRSYTEALESAKQSYAEDIDAGFEILHLDPNRAGPNGEPAADLDTYIQRTMELMVYCHNYAAQKEKQISFEVGTDEGVIGELPADSIIRFYEIIARLCRIEQIPLPDFLVMTTGTKVMEARNTGVLSDIVEAEGKVGDDHVVTRMVKFCNENNLLLKEHNADYLSPAVISWHPAAGIHSANVAPEFGVAETRAILELMQRYGAAELQDRFVALALASGKFKKWMLPQTTATDLDRAIIAGHYIFALPEFAEIKQDLAQYCVRDGIDLDRYLVNAVRNSILRYTDGFGLSNGQAVWSQNKYYERAA
ncbi:MAG TPA: class II D-tagatose-bisphosphate aldolase, non-catalytic subunit [Alphaproteobacteria bacterium]|nr:class II D-tagatose-bisphosphate aldolase, non-catalytic subunit [Alphaproteobacteria bacterium]